MENSLFDWLGRMDGPLWFRIIQQVVIALLLGYRHGVSDWMNADPPYFWNTSQVLPGERAHVVRSGLEGIVKVLLLGVGLDCLFQYLVGGSMSPGAALLATMLLCVPSYLLFRGNANRWSCWKSRKQKS